MNKSSIKHLLNETNPNTLRQTVFKKFKKNTVSSVILYFIFKVTFYTHKKTDILKTMTIQGLFMIVGLVVE